MMLTLFADASFCPKTGAAGWGSWAIKDGWPKGKFLGGPIRRELSTSNTAELCGIAAALWKHDQDGDLEGVTALMLQCDNVTALGYILAALPQASVRRLKNQRNAPIGLARTQNKLHLEALDAIRKAGHGRRIFLRHVKGHNGTDDGRSWVNTQCDAEARRHMEARRVELRAGSHFEVMQ